MIKADAREPQERSASSPGRNLFLTALPFLMAEYFPAIGVGRLGAGGLLLQETLQFLIDFPIPDHLSRDWLRRVAMRLNLFLAVKVFFCFFSAMRRSFPHGALRFPFPPLPFLPSSPLLSLFLSLPLPLLTHFPCPSPSPSYFLPSLSPSPFHFSSFAFFFFPPFFFWDRIWLGTSSVSQMLGW